MKKTKRFKKGPYGIYTFHHLNDENLHHNTLFFNDVIIKVEPNDHIWVGIYQFEDGVVSYHDKLVFSEFKSKYLNEANIIHFNPNSKVFLALQIMENNGLVMLADALKFNYDKEQPDNEKLDYSEMPEFEFELIYDLSVNKNVTSLKME